MVAGAVITFGIAYAQPSRVASSDLLARRVSSCTVQNESRLEALVRFGRENGIPLGIEFSTPELAELADVKVPATDVRGVIFAILGPSERYLLSQADGAVSIRRGDAPSPGWLDRKVPRFRIPKTQITWAMATLWMAVEVSINPDRRGFAGTYPPGDPADQVGPMDLRNSTVRELLNRLAGASGHSSWVVTTQDARLVSPASVNRFWTTIYRPNPMFQLPGALIPRAGVR